MNNIYFYYLLEKAVANNITEDEVDELWDYLWHCESTDMEIILIHESRKIGD